MKCWKCDADVEKDFSNDGEGRHSVVCSSCGPVYTFYDEKTRYSKKKWSAIYENVYSINKGC